MSRAAGSVRGMAPRFALCAWKMEMSGTVTARAECDEILFGVISEPATGVDVVDLKNARRSAILAAPSVARARLAGKPAIGVGFKAQSRLFPFESVQGRSSPSRRTAVDAPWAERLAETIFWRGAP